MVSFRDFILVEGEKKFDVDKFYADCKPFIEKIRGIEEMHLPKHGSSKEPLLYHSWEIKKVMQRKRPRDTPIELHNAVDNYFKTRFGWQARTQSIFTTGDYELASVYGLTTLCFPIGKNFQTLWGEGVEDLYHWFRSFKEETFQDELEDPDHIWDDEESMNDPMLIKQAFAEIKKIRWYYNRALKEGYESGSEVLINVDKVYLIDMSSKAYDSVIKHLKSLRMITV